MDGTEDCIASMECESSRLPEFPVPGKRERGLWNSGGEGVWLRLLDILWRHSYVRTCLASAALLSSVRTAGFVNNTTHSSEGEVSPGSHLAAENLPFKTGNTVRSAGTEALYMHLLRRAIASAAALECAVGEPSTRAGACAQSGSSTAAQEQAEPRICTGDFDATQNFPLNSLRNTSFQIPPLLHFVWCGGKPLPGFFMHFKRSWKNSPLIHALWTDAEIKDLVALVKGKDCDAPHAHRCHAIVPVHSGEWKCCRQGPTDANRELYVSRTLAELAHMVDAEDRLGAKSDLVRLLLLHSYGGVYADVDMELIREFPSCFLTHATFFAGAQREDAVELGNALLGCTPRHELLTYVITQIVEHRASTDEDNSVQAFRIIECYTGGSSLLCQGEHASPLVRSNREAMEVIRSTGPGQLTKAVMGWLQNRASSLLSRRDANCARQEHASASHGFEGLESVCICPPCVFYPVPNHARTTLKRGDKVVMVYKLYLERSTTHSVVSAPFHAISSREGGGWKPLVDSTPCGTAASR